MPRLKIYNRFWLVASDDFVGIGVVIFVFRTIWALCTAVAALHLWHIRCQSERLIYAYLGGSLCISVAMAIVAVAVVRVSAKGCIMERQKRAPLNGLLHVLVALNILEVAWTTFGIYALIGRFFNLCNLSEGQLAPGLIISGNIVIAIIYGLLVLFTVMCWHDRTSHIVELQEGEEYHATRHRTISRIITQLCCCTSVGKSSGSSVDPYEEVSALLISLLSEEIADIAPSDIVAALILLRRDHALQYDEVDMPGEDVVDINDHASVHDILEAGYYVKYAVASYGWPVYLYTHLSSGLCSLLNYTSKAFCGCCKRESRPRRRHSLQSKVMSDNCCWCNFSAMRLKTGVVDDDDVVFFNYQNSYGETPYYVVRDHERRSIVVCIRGSMSLNDALTDFNATPALFEENSEHWCHQGILYAARYVYQELQTRQLLEQAFDGFERYDLVVVGHSLGAATAALLSIMLAPRYEARLKCFAYSSPSGLMSASLTKRCTEYCLSVVVGRDIVPQLSVPNLARFRDEMVAAVQQSTRPKYDILANGVRSAITSVLTNRKTSENELDLEAGVREQQPFLALPGMSESSTTVRMPMPTYEYEADAVSCLPGRVLHLINAEPPNVATEIKKQYVACWRDKQFFTRIMLSTEAITEHMPDVVQNALEDVCKDISFKSGVHL